MLNYSLLSGHEWKGATQEITDRLKPVAKDQMANHRYPTTNIRLCPYTSPHLPAGNMNVPTAKLYAATVQLS